MAVSQRFESIRFRQTGVALVSMLFLLVMLSTMAIYQMEDQNLSIRRTANLIEAEQAFQIATGGEQWALKILEKDLVTDIDEANPDFDHFGEIWFSLGPPVKVEGTESYMQVAIIDEQGKFNLNNLVQGKPSPNGNEPLSEEVQQSQDSDAEQSPETENQEQTDNQGEQPQENENEKENEVRAPAWYSIFQKLLLGLELDPLLADVVVDWIDEDNEQTGTSGAEDQFYKELKTPHLAANRQLSSIGELYGLRGFTPEIVSLLAPFVSAIPLESGSEFTKINVNTAPAEVLGALADGPPVPATAYAGIIESRLQLPFETVDDFIQAYVATAPLGLLAGAEQLLDVRSNYFASRSCAETGKVKLSQISLLKKNRTAENVTVQQRKSVFGCPPLHAGDSADS